MLATPVLSPHQNDELFHIKREISHLVRRAESAQTRTPIISRKKNQVPKFVLMHHQNPLFWKEFSRKKGSEMVITKKQSSVMSGGEKGMVRKRCKSAFLRGMLKEEKDLNRLEKVRLKVVVLEEEGRSEALPSRRSRRQLIEQHIYLQQGGLERQAMVEGYLEAKREFPVRRISQQALRQMRGQER